MNHSTGRGICKRDRKDFDVIVVGGGHAGCEAAYASAKLGCETALLTLDCSKIGMMSCNPAMGGLAKGQLIKEIDALGGLMGRMTDQVAIQYRRLNESKGPAVRSSRAQCDKLKYAAAMQSFLRTVPHLTHLEAEMLDLMIEEKKVHGVRLKDGSEIRARAVVITSGTFLMAVMHQGEKQTAGGRVGEKASVGLSANLEALGFRLRRLKTGTPPRLSSGSIDFDRLEEQPGDQNPRPFSFYQELQPFPLLPQISCFITHTNPEAHEIINKNIKRSPMYSGAITGVGPRYCPSIEDKVNRFAERDRHQMFLEPEGLDVDDVYVNGVSTSLPEDVQRDFIHKIKGLERAEFLRFGYAVEYDSVDARQLQRTLESKDIKGLYFAGQVNGTSGYEEAGAQGLVAGTNAGLEILEKEALILTRSDSYAGVMIDDLTLKGSDEPYRMFTSRAEYRLLLREDNADLRLSPIAWDRGILLEQDFRKFERKRHAIEKLKGDLNQHFFKPSQGEVFESRGWTVPKDRISAADLLKRPEVSLEILNEMGFPKGNVPRGTEEQAEIQIKYAGYIKRDEGIIRGVRKNESYRVPLDLDFNEVPGLSNEIRGKLMDTRPETLGQASRIQGVTPAALANLLLFLKMRDHGKRPERNTRRKMVRARRKEVKAALGLLQSTDSGQSEAKPHANH